MGGKMKLIEILNQRRADFSGILRCEFCHEHQGLMAGYDDSRFHCDVIPAIRCVNCNRRTDDVLKEGITDPGTCDGFAVELKNVTVKKWVKK